MQEEIQIKGESKRTVVKFFTNFSGQSGTDDATYFVVTDTNDNPLKISDSKFDTKFGLNAENYNIPMSAISNGYRIYSGSVIQTEYNVAFTQEEKNLMSARYINGINQKANIGSQINLINNPFSTVFFEEYPFTDYYMDVKINRSIGTLDTLNIYNVALNEPPKFSNNTGVLIGKLEAVQILSDENGDKIRIPLKNTVVGIFNPSETFPSISSSDNDGNRIRLNLYETIPQVDNPYQLKGYSSFQSYLTDIDYSKNDYQNKTIPEEYKYTTITNERGEFILQNIPVGQQTLMVEVDLLKFGLEPEEIALNFFPYPSQNDSNVSEIPHLFFGQYPINIVPSWGDFQTGYTEMTLSVALDLRKWNTYYTYPIAAKYGQGATHPYIIEELFVKGFTNPLTVLIRDMTRPFNVNDRPKVELVKIPDIYDKNTDLYSSWNSEFKTKNNKVEFDTTAFNAFKLPANLYDPKGINSKGERGVWLNAYTFKIFYANEEVSWQATGMANNWVTDNNGGATEVFSSHFDLNRSDDWVQNVPNGETKAVSAIGRFPYEKSWSLTYPDNYKITKKPSVPNPYKQWNSNNGNPIIDISGQTINPQIEPRYLDGDLVGGGDAWATDANGFGLQDYWPGIFGNMFSREVSKNELWRYEAVDWWSEEWSNGYMPGLSPNNQTKYLNIPGIPSTGKPDIDLSTSERYMRLESGYAYWLKPRGWPRINVQNSWGDFLLQNDANMLADHGKNSVYNGYYSTWDGIYKYLDDVTLVVGAKAPWFSKNGRLTSYRIEKPYYNNPKKPPFVEKFVELNFGPVMFDGTKPHGGSNADDTGLCNFDVGCGQNNQLNTVYNAGLGIINKGTIKVTIDGKEIFPEETYFTKLSWGTIITLPANTSYNPKTNSYERADYEFWFQSVCNGDACQSCGPYAGNTGELCGVFDPYKGWDSALNCFHRLKYHIDNLYGLPAFIEEDSKKTYYLTSIPAYPLDRGNFSLYGSSSNSASIPIPIPDSDFARWISFGQNYNLFRTEGLAYMAKHENFISPSDPSLRWTRTKPSQFMKSQRTSDSGSLTGIYLRVLWGENYSYSDIDFKNIY